MDFTGFFERLGDIVPRLLYILPVILISLTVHEYCHAFVAFKQGDYTARNQGRISLNPLVHLDPIGTLMIIFTALGGLGFGWAKPVPINPAYFRDWKLGMRLVGLAGPLSNFALATLSMILIKILEPFLISSIGGIGFDILMITYTFLTYMILINIGLGVFNLLPFPPLDGSKIFGSFMPDNIYIWMMNNEQYIAYGLIAIYIFVPGVLDSFMSPLMHGAITGLDFLLSPIDMLMKLFVK